MKISHYWRLFLHLINTSINITDLDKIYNINATSRFNEINKKRYGAFNFSKS